MGGLKYLIPRPNNDWSFFLHGRPLGGTIILIKNELCKETRTIHCDERYVMVKVANHIFVNARINMPPIFPVYFLFEKSANVAKSNLLLGRNSEATRRRR